MGSSESATVIFPETNSEIARVRTKLTHFVENSHVPDFSQSERQGLLRNLKELKRQGFGKVAHFVHRGSLTGLSVEASLPSEVTGGHYEQYHVGTRADIRRLRNDSPFRQYLLAHPEHVIEVGEGGEISPRMQHRLDSALRNRVGIILGGGPGTARDPVYKPLIQSLDVPIQEGTPVLGICLGHQLIGEYLSQYGKGGGTSTGPYGLGPGMEVITETGKRHQVFGRLGNAVNVMHVHHDRWNPGESPTFARILSRDAAGDSSAMTVDIAFPEQAVTWQAHPEFPMRGHGVGYSTAPEPILVDGMRVTIPKGTHNAYASFIKYFMADPKNFARLSDRYNMTPRDVKDMVHGQRLATHLGERFYGPAVYWMSTFRLNHE